MIKYGIVFLLIIRASLVSGQDFRWQQRAEYTMNVALDVQSHRLSGTQKLVYHNNSPDTLNKVYYHLYYNAFQPGSMMDVRSRNILDPDPRVKDRISQLKENEIGYQHIESLQQDGKVVNFSVDGTVMEVSLAKPLLPHSKSTFLMKFDSQIPVMIRRSGRDNKEGISYSMTQWFPKIAEYDHQGWHAYQYVAREFHGVWGDFDVSITLDPTFVVCGTGKLQNADKIGYGYEKPGTQVKRQPGNLTWHFIARNVIDFAWAADPDFIHEREMVPGGPELHFFYQPGTKTTEKWKKLPAYIVRHFEFMNRTFGTYPYDVFSVIQGGDQGMEYPMCAFVYGEGSFGSLVGTTAHESAHSWYQGVLASNESLYAWMDEGFADFSSQESMAILFNTSVADSHAASYENYFSLVRRDLQEPMNQHSDHFNTHTAYNSVAYAMGTIFLQQLKYIVGETTFYIGMRRYYNLWRFKHPEPNDFIRVMEKVSGLQLKWYLSYWVNTTKKIDYGVRNVVSHDASTMVTLERPGDFPMPIDLLVTFKDGTTQMIYIPSNEMLGKKSAAESAVSRIDFDPWLWVSPSYTFKIDKPVSAISSLEIDPLLQLADVNRKNNKIELDRVSPYKRTTR
ncbi:MAG: M1 family metallopeptidase [Chryseolinea sp.]